MKILLTGLFFLLVLPEICLSQVVISGHLYNTGSSPIFLYEPINGFSNNTDIAKPDFELHPDKAGFFSKKINLNHPAFLTIRIGAIPVWLFAEPNDKISVEIDAAKFTNTSTSQAIKITGGNSEGNELYNAFNFVSITKINRFQKVLDSLQFKENLTLTSVDYALNQIMLPFDSLYKSRKVTKAFNDAVMGDIKGVLLRRVTGYLFFENNGKMKLADALNIAEQLYSKYPVTEEKLKSGLYNTGIAYNYYFSKARKDFDSYRLKDSTLHINGKNYVVNKEFVQWLYAPPTIAEHYWAMFLLSLQKLFPNDIGKKDAETFRAVFPDSKMNQYLQPPYFKLTENILVKKDSSSFVFTPIDTINSLNSFLSKFKGEKLFIDFWATWCFPCRMEFSNYNATVDSFCTKNRIRRIYVAFERSNSLQSIKRTVYGYNLKGTHVIPNKNLVDDIVKKIYVGEETYSVPRIILVNEKGEIVNVDAPRMSLTKELFQAIITGLKL